MKFIKKWFGGGGPAALPLIEGDFSEMAKEARSEEWIRHCVASVSTQDNSFATDILLRSMRAADFLVTKIEEEKPVLAFFAGASRDVLIYEAVIFFVHAVQDQLQRTLPDEHQKPMASFADIALLSAGKLAAERMGEFDSKLYRKERAKHYLRYVGNPKDMTECFVGILLCAKGRTAIQQPDGPLAWDTDLDVQLGLRGIVHPAAVAGILATSKAVAAHLAESFDSARYRRERNFEDYDDEDPDD